MTLNTPDCLSPLEQWQAGRVDRVFGQEELVPGVFLPDHPPSPLKGRVFLDVLVDFFETVGVYSGSNDLRLSMFNSMVDVRTLLIPIKTSPTNGFCLSFLGTQAHLYYGGVLETVGQFPVKSGYNSHSSFCLLFDQALAQLDLVERRVESELGLRLCLVSHYAPKLGRITGPNLSPLDTPVV